MIVGKAITAGGAGGIPCTLTVLTDEGALVEATLGSKKISKVAGVDGTAILILEKEGTWTVSATLGGETMSTEILVEHNVEVNLSFFPEEPSSYEQIVLITSSQTWEVPENGYFQIEVFGASGNGGNGVGHEPLHVWLASGGGGGGGGYSCSRVKLKKGETVELTVGSVGATSYAKINSSVETYNTISVTSGANGGNATIAGNGLYDYHPGGGGAGGIATGGNYANKNGGYGGTGYRDEEYDCRGGDGGAAGYTGGRVGGVGGEGMDRSYSSSWKGNPGAAGFIKIYRGDTNVA